MIRFACPKCRAPYTVADEHAGRTTTCRSCSAPLVVPAAPPAGKGNGVLPVAELADDDGRGRAIRPPAGRFAEAMRLRRVLWGLCTLWTAFVTACYFTGEAHAETVFQQVANAAGCCFLVIAAYVGCRAIDFFAERVDRAARRL